MAQGNTPTKGQQCHVGAHRRVAAHIDVTLTGGMYGVRHALPLVIERGGGSIVNTSSSSEWMGEPEHVAFNEKETTMASNEEIIRNLYAVAEKEPKPVSVTLHRERLLVGRPCRSQIPRRRCRSCGRHLLGCISGHAPRTLRPLLRR